MNSAKICWADIVTGKVRSASPAAQEFKFNSEAPEFAINELKMNASAQEFVPPPAQSFSPSAKEFFPPEHKLLHRATEMQRLLLECYTDDDDSSDDEVRCQPPAAMPQKRKQVRKRLTPAVAHFRPPPGLSPPEDVSLNSLAHAALNPSAKEFAPVAVHVPEWRDVACKYASAINFGGICSDSSDDESAEESAPAAVHVHQWRDVACKAYEALNASAEEPAPAAVHVHEWRDVACKTFAALNASEKESAPAAVHVPEWRDVACKYASAINFAGFSSDSEDDESPASTPRNSSKMDLQDSTSAGESSDSETESWSGLHSA